MHLVVHQHVRVQLDISREQRIAEQMQTTRAITVIQKTGQAIVVALHDVLRDSGQVHAGLAGLGCMISPVAARRNEFDRAADRHMFTPSYVGPEPDPILRRLSATCSPQNCRTRSTACLFFHLSRKPTLVADCRNCRAGLEYAWAP